MHEVPVFVGCDAVKRPTGVIVDFKGSDPTFNLAHEKIETRLGGEIPPRLLDLLEIACGIYAADQQVRRGGATRRRWGEDWRRSFRFTIAVRDLQFWQRSDVKEALVEAVNFLTEDDAGFAFVQSSSPASSQTYFPFDPQAGGAFQADDVILFSGGLDSLAGAVETLATTDRNVVLVTHTAAPKVHTFQKALAEQVAARFPGRTFWLPIRATLRDREASESTQRSRTLLFAAMGALASSMFSASRLKLYENGIVSLNLPISEQIVGTMATRTTHPRSVALLGQLLSLVNDNGEALDNPYLFRTKGEVVQALTTHGSADLVSLSFSCSKVRTATKEHRHCGVCSQCIDRRFGVLAAGADDHDPGEAYDVDLLLGAREDDQHRVMALDYVTRAQFALRGEALEFAARFGAELAPAASSVQGHTRSEAMLAIYELHQRHGIEIDRVLEAALKENAGRLIKGDVPGTALLLQVQTRASPSVPTAVALHSREPTGKGSPLQNGYGLEHPLEIAGDHAQARFIVRGLVDWDQQRAKLCLALLRQFECDLRNGLNFENHNTIAAATLADGMGLDDVEHVRKVVERCRNDLADAYDGHFGYRPSGHLLIHNVRRKGYRLDPRTKVIALEQLE